MKKIIKTNWCVDPEKPFTRARVLHHTTHPEGLDIDRIRFQQTGKLPMNLRVGHIISIRHGSARLCVKGPREEFFHLTTGVHLYLPPGQAVDFEAEAGTELLRVSSPNAEQTRGRKLLIRDEMFLAACATETQSLRWSFTPQYLCRRIFLHHDQTLLSRSGTPISWFRTTMFDMTGLPENDEGEPVFRMSYNSRTEFNICCDVKGSARVRMACHPYLDSQQQWGPWLQLDAETAYHLNEVNEEECRIDEATESLLFFRNKHEIQVSDGHLSLFCLFDPAPIGIESHQRDTYRDEEPLAQVLGTRLYDNHQRELAKFDEMVHELSFAKAKENLGLFRDSPMWELYLRGRLAQVALESKVVTQLTEQGNQRAMRLAEWMQQEGY